MTAWRTIITDSGALTGVAPVCGTDHTLHSNIGLPLTNWVFDCCPHPHLETWSESDARKLADGLTRIDAAVCS